MELCGRSAKQVGEKLSGVLGPRVSFIDESIFPINWVNVSEVMIHSVRDKGTLRNISYQNVL